MIRLLFFLAFATFCQIKATSLLYGSEEIAESSVPCDFETDFCGWRQTAGDSTDWVRHKGPLAGRRENVGPLTDSKGNSDGWYIYVNSSDSKLDHDFAFLKSPLLKYNINSLDSNLQCFSFAYHMQNKHSFYPHDLQLHTSLNGNESLIKPVWWEWGNHGNRWLEANVTLSTQLPFALVFRGVKADGDSTKNNYADIALDNIRLSSGPCGSNSASVNCTFDNGVCSWSRLNGASYYWTTGNNASPMSNLGLGPREDHTSGNGTYVFIHGNPIVSTYSIAQMMSPSINFYPGNAKCLTFWYFMNGDPNSRLVIHLALNGSMGAPIWQISGAHGNMWKRATVPIHPVDYRTTLSVIIEATQGPTATVLSNIAVDDVTLFDGPCTGGPEQRCVLIKHSETGGPVSYKYPKFPRPLTFRQYSPFWWTLSLPEYSLCKKDTQYYLCICWLV
ncbi:MAM and LDL-receptor class A domain-containing protein 1-like [Tachypleus tridentatus]|uniref:MAM and LDL-receptor class A domain-containing protein 1-like n=1 Tax=Tachypleus tridentatus TaxID=6853 RepID=UPI003FD0DEAB